MSDFSIRPFAAGDLERVQDIAELAWKPIFDSFRKQLGKEILNQTRPLAEKDKRHQLASWVENHPDKIIVAVDNNQKIIGFATWFLDEVHKVGIINNNAVDKTSGYKGVGLNEKFNQAFLIVTHDEKLASFAKRRVVMHGGIIQGA